VSENGLMTFPDSVTDRLNIQTEKAVKEVEVFSLFGSSVLKADKQTVDMTPISTGIYFVQITFADGEVFTAKIVKK